MNIRQLEIFTAVAETGSITKTAEQMYLSQPAISKTIRELETDIGVPLFDRIDNRLHLNSAGRAFRIRATRLLTEFHELASFGRTQTQALPLRVGTSMTIGQISLPAAVTRFRQLYPDTPLKIYSENVQRIKARLLDGDVDVAFLEGFESSQSFTATPISEYPLLAVGAPQLAPTNQLTKKELLTVPFLLREKGSTLRDHFDEQMHQMEIDIEPMLQSTSTAVLINAAKAGLGLTIIPAPFAEPYLTEGTLQRYELPGQEIRTINYAITLKGSAVSTVQQALVDCFMRQH
ncbi:MAG: LysR family transcriptional regulator [Schleiferilactobacillus harbinensis]|jgi:DNA-binding transcriptional LysR family regulator|nr:LysR family transcriptional regulator [Schleiferilactobacillus harbinensis]